MTRPLLPKKLLRKAIVFRTKSPHKDLCSLIDYPHDILRKRVSRSVSGSMTVEASAAIPLFLFCLVNLFSLILFFHTFLTNLEELHQQGRQLSMLAYSTKDLVELEDEMIQLIRPVRVKPPIAILGYPGTTIVSTCYMRAWTGYDAERAQSEETEKRYVYLTENGSVYHISGNCTHLSLSIEMAAKAEVETLRNEDGGRYFPCEKCGGSGSLIVYVAREGDRYHNTISCSGLKRTVRRIPITEVNGRPVCSRCG